MPPVLLLLFLACVLVSVFSVLQGLVLLLIAASPRQAPHRSAGSCVHFSVCVLVPCYNESVVVRRTLESIFRSTGVDIARVICIDDGSTDGTVDVMLDVKRQYGDRMTVLRQRNAGKATALEHGLSAVDTPVFVSVDADTMVMPDAIGNLLELFQDREVAAVSGQMLVGNRDPSSAAVYSAQAREYEFANNIDRRAFSRLHRITVVPGAIGAFRTEAVSAVGGYPVETLAEDAHLTFNLLMHGHKVLHEPSAVVLTEAPDTLRGLFTQRVRWATGKTQVTLRTGAPALRQRGATRLLWLHTALNQAILPMITLPTSIGLVALPAYLLSVVAEGARPVELSWLPAMVVVAVLVTLLQLTQSWLATRFARNSDADVRTAVGLNLTRLGPISLMIMPITVFLASWVAWYVILTRGPKAWNKLHRTGDVALPPAIRHATAGPPE